MRKVCFVTPDLHPLTSGGIGRLIANLMTDCQRRALPIEFHVLLSSGSSINEVAFTTAWPAVKVHRARTLDHGNTYPDRAAFTDTDAHADSLEIMLALTKLEHDGLQFDVIEFVDFLGQAFCSIQEKRLGLALQESRLSIRLHGTAGIIQAFEGATPTLPLIARSDLERKSLLDADQVVAHLSSVADAYQRSYGFTEAWRKAVRVELPPIVVDAEAPKSPPQGRDLIFSTKLQATKRPDLFAKGAAQFMVENPTYAGRAIFACEPPTDDVRAHLRSLVPAALAHRFEFVTSGRERLMADGIVVISSEYESLNLTAYEAASSGAVLVLNGRCPAFSPGSPFHDGVDAWLFDGTVDGLAKSLKSAWRTKLPNAVRWSAPEPYFAAAARAGSTAPPRTRPGKPKTPRAPRVSVLVTNFNLARHLPTTLKSIRASSYPSIEIILVDDASTNPDDHAYLATLEGATAAGDLTIVRNQVNRGLAASRNIAFDRCRGDYVLPLDADDCIAPGFVTLAVRALETSADFDGVVPTTASFLSDEALERGEYSGFRCFLGDAPNIGMLDNRLSTATALMRSSVLEQHRYDERLESYEDWSLYLRATLAGARFLVTNDVQFFYRRRPGSMIQQVDQARHQRLLAQIYRSLPTPLPASVQLANLPALLTQWEHRQPLPHTELRYVLVDKLNDLLKHQPQVHRVLKALRHLIR